MDELYLWEMKISNNSGFSGANWTSFIADIDWTFPEPYGEEKIVFVMFKDVVGWKTKLIWIQ